MNHPKIEKEQMVERYVMGKLPAAQAERFEEHYLTCQDCLDALARAERFDRALKGVAVEETARMEAAARLGLLAWVARLARSPALVLGLLLLIVLPSGLLLRHAGRLGGELERALEPQVNTRILRLSPERSSLGAEGPAARITLAPSPEWIVLSLEHDAEGYETYRAELRKVDGEIIWHRAGLDSDAAGAQVILLPSRLLEPGDFLLRLEGIDREGEGVDVASFPFRVHR